MKALTLDNLRRDGACAAGLAWIKPLLKRGGPTESNWRSEPGYWKWAAIRGFDVPLTPGLVMNRPIEVLRHVANLLDRETLRACALKEPSTALRHVANLLDPETLRACANCQATGGPCNCRSTRSEEMIQNVPASLADLIGVSLYDYERGCQ